MKTAVSLIFILALLGMLIVYPMYFYALNEFKKKLMSHHPDVWNRLATHRSRTDLQTAYRALETSRKSQQIDGVPLHAEVMMARKKATKLLYVGTCLFMVVLGIGLIDSVIAGKNP